MPHLLKLISDLTAFDRLVYWEIHSIDLTLMTSSEARTPELRMIIRLQLHYESTSLNRIAADKSHRIIAALDSY